MVWEPQYIINSDCGRNETFCLLGRLIHDKLTNHPLRRTIAQQTMHVTSRCMRFIVWSKHMHAR